jgi:hypothetical protein
MPSYQLIEWLCLNCKRIEVLAAAMKLTVLRFSRTL